LALLFALSVLLVSSLSPHLFCQVAENQSIEGSSAVTASSIKLPDLRPATALTIMNRMSLLIGRTSFIFGEWLGLIR
jgi:hypothetical protein